MKNKILYALGVISMIAILGGCSKVSDEDLRAAHIAADNGALIIDVRTREEFNAGHVQNAVNLPVQLLERYYEQIPQDKAIVVYCRTGSRSQMAAEFLGKKGWKVYDVATQEEWERKLPAISEK
jgi:phage shock protein E